MATKTTGYPPDELKSRRAHSTCLGTSEMYQLFDAISFAEDFDHLNPTFKVWDAVSGVRS